jgi:hypothetical protein
MEYRSHSPDGSSQSCNEKLALSIEVAGDDDFGAFQAVTTPTPSLPEPVLVQPAHILLSQADELLTALLTGRSRKISLPFQPSSTDGVGYDTLLPALNRPLLHTVLTERLHSYAGFSQRRNLSSSSLQTDFFNDMHIASHGQLGSTPNHHWLGSEHETSHQVFIATDEYDRFAAMAASTNRRLVQNGMSLSLRIAEAAIDRATPLEFDLEASTDRLAQLEVRLGMLFVLAMI